MKKHKSKKTFLEYLAKNPIVSAACDHAGIARQTAYKWKNEDPEFKELMEDALSLGDSLIDDMAESQLFAKIRSGHWPATKFRLEHSHHKYRQSKQMTYEERMQRKRNREQEAEQRRKEEEERDREAFMKKVRQPIDLSTTPPILIERILERRRQKGLL